MRFCFSSILLATALVIGFVASANANAIVVNACDDTYLSYHYALDATAPHGAESTVFAIGRGPGADAFPLVKFDLRAYAGESVIGSSATVELYVVDAYPYQNPTQSIEVHQSRVAWDEATVTIDNYGGSFWIDSNKIGPVMSTSVVSWNATSRYVSWSIPSSLVQTWIDDPSSNNGLFFLSTTTSLWQDLQFASRENPLGLPPRLQFNLVPEPSSSLLLGTAVLALVGFYWQRRMRTS